MYLTPLLVYSFSLKCRLFILRKLWHFGLNIGNVRHWILSIINLFLLQYWIQNTEYFFNSFRVYRCPPIFMYFPSYPRLSPSSLCVYLSVCIFCLVSFSFVGLPIGSSFCNCLMNNLLSFHPRKKTTNKDSRPDCETGKYGPNYEYDGLMFYLLHAKYCGTARGKTIIKRRCRKKKGEISSKMDLGLPRLCSLGKTQIQSILDRIPTSG